MIRMSKQNRALSVWHWKYVGQPNDVIMTMSQDLGQGQLNFVAIKFSFPCGVCVDVKEEKGINS